MGLCKLLKTWSGRWDFEPTTSSLGIQTYVGSKSLARFCCEFLSLQHLAESAFSKSVDLNEAEMRQVVLALVGTHLGHVSNAPRIRTGYLQRWPAQEN